MYQKPNPKLHPSSLVWAMSGLLALIAGCPPPFDPPPPPEPPKANAGPNQQVDVDEEVKLDGSASRDSADRTVPPSGYSWEQRFGPNVTLDDPEARQPTFVPIEKGIYEFALTVTDAEGLVSDPDTVLVFVDTVPPDCCPTADAKIDEDEVEEGVTVTLDGCASANDESCDNSLTYDWQQTSGPTGSISDPSICNPDFEAPQVDGVDVDLEFMLTVINEDGCPNTDKVVITVRDIPPPCDGDVGCPNDGLYCNGEESCENDVCVSSGSPCETGETCDESTDSCGCVSDADCDDGDFCNGTETCNLGRRRPRQRQRGQSVGECVDGEPPCEGLPCNEETGTCECETDEQCDDDGEYCNGEESCENGTCVSNGDPCAEGETCDESTDSCGCASDADCDDGDFCNGTEKCDKGRGGRGGQSVGECVLGDPPSCVGGQVCCEEDQACIEETDTCGDCETAEGCDDRKYCTGVETCVNGECFSDGNPCPPDKVCLERTNECGTVCPLPFQFVSETLASGARKPKDVRLVDLNNDLVLDLVVAHDNNNNNVAVHFGLGDGRFRTPDLYDGDAANQVRAGDVNADGFVDMVVTSWPGKTIAIFFGTAESRFSEPTKIQLDEAPVGLALADLNGDDNLDIVVTLWNKGKIATLLGRGNGTFDSPRVVDVGLQPNNVIAVDLDGDNLLDLAVTNAGNNISILIGTGDGSFVTEQKVEIGRGTNSITAGYFNDDDFIDLAVAKRYVGVTVLFGAADGRFPTQVSVPEGGSGVSVADIDGDKFDDIVTAASDGKVVILLSNGDNEFQTNSHQAGDDPQIPVVGDLDGDADVDIVVLNSGDALTVLRNRCKP